MKSSLAQFSFVPRTSTINLVLLSAGIVSLAFLLQGNAGFNIPDEGFLWYGTIRTALGDVPLRDFQSYDPGRYYWGALWFKLLRSDGILAMRISQAGFQFLGLTVALLLVRRLSQRWLPLLGAGLLLMIWMFPPWKIYEPVITIAAVYFAVLIIEKPSKRRHLIAGAFIGLATFFGRNQGLYCPLAFLLVIGFVWWKNDRRELLARVGALVLGIIVGYFPMLLMFVLIPGFFSSFVDSILVNLHTGTNLPLPVPWPWRIQNYSHTFKEGLNKTAIGILYLAVPAFYSLVGLGLLVKSKLRATPLLIACTFVGAAYLHYTFDRAQLYYLAWTIPPFILGLIAVPYSFSDRHRKVLTGAVWSFLLVLSWTAAEMAPQNFFLIKAKSAAREMLVSRFHMNIDLDMQKDHLGLVKTDIRGDKLWVQNDMAEVIGFAKEFNSRLGPDDNILIAPYWTGLYPILRKQSPTWEIYFLFPQPQSKQQEVIADLESKHINWAFVCSSYLDRKPELAFQNTHSYVWRYLEMKFESVSTSEKPAAVRDCELLHRTDLTSAFP
jgi:hypothetical protein